MYGSLIRQAWTMTWRYRFLWVLGVLAGGAVGMPALNSPGGEGVNSHQTAPPDFAFGNTSAAMAATAVTEWATTHVAVLIAVGALAVALALALLVVSFIAQGGMARATIDLASGRPSSLGDAWRAGTRLFWRYVGLCLAPIIAALGVTAIVGSMVAAGGVMVVASQNPWPGVTLGVVFGLAIVAGFVAFALDLTRSTSWPRWAVVVVATLFAVPLVTVLLAGILLLSITVAFAQRIIAMDDVGPLEALRSGWQLTRGHLGESLLTWLVNVGLAIATGLVAVITVISGLLALALLGGMVFAVAGLSGPLFAYVGIGGIALLLGVLTLAGIANTFFWAYWTLAYFRLSGQPAVTPGI
jgi:hypothetical protein